MEITIYSFIGAVVWSNFLILALVFLRKNNRAIIKLGIGSLIFVYIAILFRLLISVDIHGFTQVIQLNKHITNFIYFIFNEETYVLGKAFSNSGILLFIWILVSCILLSRLFISQIRGMRSYHQGFIYGKQQKRAWNLADEISKEVGISNRMEIIVTESTNIPIMSGFFKLRIFLPNIDYSDETLKNILLHEMIHFKNKDTHYKLLTKIVCPLLLVEYSCLAFMCSIGSFTRNSL